MIGHGRDRLPDPTYWNSSWVAQPGPSTFTGYTWASSQSTPRWGTNVVSYTNSRGGSEREFRSRFRDDLHRQHALRWPGSHGRFGRGHLYKDADGTWQLAGIMFSISQNVGQPGGSSAFGNVTYIADLSAYRSEILTAINANHAPSGTSRAVTTLQGTPYTFAFS